MNTVNEVAMSSTKTTARTIRVICQATARPAISARTANDAQKLATPGWGIP
jgi:hypothetical protein